jgi:hypothetical protein
VKDTCCRYWRVVTTPSASASAPPHRLGHLDRHVALLQIAISLNAAFEFPVVFGAEDSATNAA